MHKNIDVVELVVDEASVAITKTGALHAPEHLPLGVYNLKSGIDRRRLNDWLKSRSIPAGRSGIWELYKRLGRDSTEYLILKCYGLSLSDHYWIRPTNPGLKWDDINFFQNSFSTDVGEILFGREPENTANINLVSPDNTSDGWLRKKWIIADGKRVLVKGGSGAWKQEPYNEVIASAIMGRLGIAHTHYTLTAEGGEPYCLCENFLSVDTELVTAWHVLHSREADKKDSDLRKIDSQDSGYTHLIKCCDELNIPNARRDLEKMISVDYIIANEDRHYANFGFVRNAETLEWLGLAPLYDSGASLWYNSATIGLDVPSKPFRTRHVDQLKLVENFSWFRAEALSDIENEVAMAFAGSPHVDERRSASIANEVSSRAATISHLACGS